jgi:hypothetical protein
MLSRKLTLLEALLNLRTGPPLTFTMTNGTPMIGMSGKHRLIAKLTGHDFSSDTSAMPSGDYYTTDDDCRYSWIEQDMTATGTCGTTDQPGGHRGFVDKMPAIDLNGVTDLDDGTVVELFLAPQGDHYRFSSPGGGVGGNGGCCIGAPYGIFAFSSMTCCDSTNGFATGQFYLFWNQECVPYIYTDYTEAVSKAAELGLDTTVYGLCPGFTPP